MAADHPEGAVIRTRPRQGRVRTWAEFLALRGFAAVIRALPWARAQAVGRALGRLAFRWLRRRRAIALANLQAAFPDRTGGERTAAARAVFEQVGSTVTEFAWAARFDREALLRAVSIEGREHLDAALVRGRGVVIVSAHFGNWELTGLAVSALGCPLDVVGRALDNRLIDAWVNRERRRFGGRVINSKSPAALREMLRSLHENRAVALLLDQTVIGDRGVFVDFLGRLAYTHKVLALLARKTGATVLPVFALRAADGQTRVVIEPPLVLVTTPDRDADVLENTQRVSRVIERRIRERPELWMWLHDRWRKQPPAAAAAVFLDRDGTVSEEVGYIRRLEDLALIPGAAAAIRALNQRGIRTILVTNQSGIARGYYPEAFVRQVNDRLGALLAARGARLDAIYFCPHHPTEGSGPERRDCGCRKPRAGMVLAAVRDLGIDPRRAFVVGDKRVDIEMARRVGATGILVLTGYGAAELEHGAGTRPERVAKDLAEAVAMILEQVPAGTA